MNTMQPDNDIRANDLTQLSSREQLSALMDGALPADQARFLLRRLQHDAPLAECWERWRLCGETMRGLAPAQRMPADFALRVSVALQAIAPAEQARQAHGQAAGLAPRRTPAWLRWGGGAAVAASLAMVALMVRQQDDNAPGTLVSPQVAAASTPAPHLPTQPDAPAPALADASDAVAALAAAAVVRPLRREAARPRALPAAMATTSAPVTASAADAVAATALASAEAATPAAVLQAPITTRPWPRSVLPQYGNQSLTVAFGERVQPGIADNPFGAPAFAGTSLHRLQPPAGMPASQAEAHAADEASKPASPAEAAPAGN